MASTLIPLLVLLAMQQDVYSIDRDRIIANNIRFLTGSQLPETNLTDQQYQQKLKLHLADYVLSGRSASIWALFLDLRISKIVREPSPECLGMLSAMEIIFRTDSCNASKHEIVYREQFDECNPRFGCLITVVSICIYLVHKGSSRSSLYYIIVIPACNI